MKSGFMFHSGVATFTLDDGKCPRWLFERMVRLGREMTQVLIAEYGPREFIRRISDPVWFQALGTVLAFDWNASGLTTILTAALKEAIRGREKDFGVFICGGKGKTSRQTPDEISAWGERLNLNYDTSRALVYNSRMAAKVDSALIQDGFQIYHHSFFFSRDGAWAVVQQGMNTQNQTARRYHWFSETPKFQPSRNPLMTPPYLKGEDNKVPPLKVRGGEGELSSMVCEPHAGIASQQLCLPALNMIAKESEKSRDLSVDLIGGGYNLLMKDIEILRRHSSALSKMMEVRTGQSQIKFLKLSHCEFHRHPAEKENFSKSKYLEKILAKVCFDRPKSYESLLAEEGVGPKTIRALSLVGEVIYGAKPSYQDPARYSFAFGGKDATPYPVDRGTYDNVIQIMKKAVNQTKLPFYEKNKMINKLRR
jgi:hypothetical protein